MTCFSPDGGRTLAIFLILRGWGVSSSDGSSELYSGSSSSLISSDKFEGLETADSNAEQLLSIYITFIYVGGELQQPLRVEAMAFSLYSQKPAQARAHRGQIGGAQYRFIVCIYLHIDIPLKQVSQTHILMVTR